MGALGFLGSAVKGDQCPGLSYTMYGLICEELVVGAEITGVAAYR